MAWLEGLDKLKKKSNELIVNRTRDLPVCSIMVQPTTLPRALAYTEYLHAFFALITFRYGLLQIPRVSIKQEVRWMSELVAM
jgi:hypothetical protein